MATTRTISTLAGAAAALLLLGPAPAHGESLPAADPKSSHQANQHELDDQRFLRSSERSQSHVPRSKETAGRAEAIHGSGYGWPVKPFHVQHPVRGFFGDPRVGEAADGHVESETFHFGVDVSAPDGTAVYATASGRIVWEPQRPETISVRQDDGTVFAYWHIEPAVGNGEQAVAYKTLLGHISRGWGHVHFAELVGGRHVNPLRPSGMQPYEDTTLPVVKSLRAERGEAGVKLDRLAGTVELVAEAFDATPLAVPAPWTNRPVTPAAVRWRVRGRAWQPAADFRRGLPAADEYDRVYARWTRQNKPWRNGRYRFYLTRGWDTSSLPNGEYRIDVAATDTRGNTAVRGFLVQVRNVSS